MDVPSSLTAAVTTGTGTATVTSTPAMTRAEVTPMTSTEAMTSGSGSNSNSDNNISNSDNSSPALLREWSYRSDAAAATVHQETNPLEVDGAVPVAPAVVLPSDSLSELRSSEKPRYNYPVATFVSNLVRHSIDSFSILQDGDGDQHHHLDDAAAHALVSDTATATPLTALATTFATATSTADAPILPTTSATRLLPTVPHSQNSQHNQEVLLVPAQRPTATATAHAVQSGNQQSTTAQTTTTIPTLEEADFVIVDGDLIALPSDTETAQAYEQQRLEREARKQKSRIKLPFKGIRKWFKKRTTLSRPPATSTTEDTNAADALADQNTNTATMTTTMMTLGAGTTPSAAAVVMEESHRTNLGTNTMATTTTTSPTNQVAHSSSHAAHAVSSSSTRSLQSMGRTTSTTATKPLKSTKPTKAAASAAQSAEVGAPVTTPPRTTNKRKAKAQRKRAWSQNRVDPSSGVLDEEDRILTTAPSLDSQSRSLHFSQEFQEVLPVTSLQQPHHPQQQHAGATDHVVDHLIPMSPFNEVVSSDGSAVNAHFVGNVEQVLESGVLTNVASAVAFVESDGKDDYWYKKDNNKMLQEEITLDSMLQQARHESEDDDLFDSLTTPAECIVSLKNPPKVNDNYYENDSKPLSEATTLDKHVWNDTLKVVLVSSSAAAVDEKSALGRALAGKRPKRPKPSLGLDVHTWCCSDSLKFCLWDIHSTHAGGAHPATQSLFFSGDSLYVLLWDLAITTAPYTPALAEATTSPVASKMPNHGGAEASRRTVTTSATQATATQMFDEEYDDEEDEDDEFLREEILRAADRTLELDICDHVLSWLDHMAYAGAAILPVVTISAEASASLSSAEIHRRCNLLQSLLMKHPAFEGVGSPHLIFGNDESIVRVALDTGEGIPELQEMIHAIGKEKVFPHIGTPVDPIIVEVNQTIRRLKEDRKVILLDHLMSEMKSRMHVEQVQDALYFLSNIGEILYYGNSTDEILSRFVILSRKWLVSALSCILRPDLQRELDETRRFMNLQCVYSGESFCESDVVQTLLQGTNSSCPILSAKDSAMLWKSMSFMREAADRTAQLSEASTTMYDFLERLLVYTGIFMPLTVSAEPTYFVPSLLDSAAAAGVWTYKTSESWMTTLCHSWLLRDGAPSNIMEHVTTCLLQDLYEYSHTFHGAVVKPVHHAKMYPLGAGSFADFLETHNHEAIGRIKIHQVVCWKSCMLVKIGTVFADVGQTELRESFSEIFVALVDEQSEYCVATRNMTNSMKRLIVCGKGQVGHHGRKLWQGGFSLVLDSLRASLADATGCRREVVCPECLAHSHPRVAGTWSWDTVQAANEIGNAGVRCTRGHLVDTNLLCGVCSTTPKPPPDVHHTPKHRKPVSKLLNSVVVVGLWDAQSREIRSVGSGFIVDKKLGLIVTAAHILFDMTPGRKFGTPYFGVRNAKAVIGVIASGDENNVDGGVARRSNRRHEHKAVFRYFAELVTHDIRNVDACVLRITTKLENDVDGEDFGGQLEIPLHNNMRNEKLSQLKITRTFELEESVRILGFNQGGEGVLEQGKHVNRCADFAKGYICKRFTNMGSDDSSTSSKGSSSSRSAGGGNSNRKDTSLRSSSGANATFIPREEIVVMCPTISGHSGGPCVNDEGRVVGILSRADAVDRQRCYLVPND